MPKPQNDPPPSDSGNKKLDELEKQVAMQEEELKALKDQLKSRSAKASNDDEEDGDW